MALLDITRPYSEASGGGVRHRFEQDGKFFDSAGQEIVDDAPVVDAPTPEPEVTQ